MVPVAGEDPVRDRPAGEREAHVGAAVVDRVDCVSVREQAQGLAAGRDDQAPGRAEVGERCDPDEPGGFGDGHVSSFGDGDFAVHRA